MFTEPVVGKDFFGRAEILNLLDKRIKAMRDGYRQNVAVTGMSLAGKSSLLQHFLYTAVEDSFLPVYVEVMKEGFRSFANRFIAAILYNSLKAKEDADPRDINSLILAAEAHLPRTVSSIRKIIADIEKGLTDEAYVNLLGLTAIVKEETSRQCVVILDEFDNIANFKIKNPFSGFGKVIMIQKDTMYIISSSRNSTMRKILREKLSLLFGNFEVVDVKGFDTATACEFLRKKSEPYFVDNGLAAFLVFFTGGNPFYMNSLIAEAGHAARQEGEGAITRGALERAITALVYGSNGTIHQYIVNLLLDLIDTRERDNLSLVLESIACGHRKQRELAKDLKRSHSDVSRSLAVLSDIGLISKNGVFWSIPDRMLEFWLAHVSARRRRTLVNYIVDRARANEEDVHSYISDFLKEAGRGPLERIHELFNLFCGEVVEIDDRKLALPQANNIQVRTFNDVMPYLAVSSGGKSWLCQIFERPISESDIAEFIKNIKSLDYKVERKVLIALRETEANAKLLAKELKISIWDLETLNLLMALYNKKGIIIL